MIKRLQNLIPKETICKQINKPSKVEGACISKQYYRHLLLWALFSVLTACPSMTISYWHWERATNTTNWNWFWLFCHRSFFLLSQSSTMELSFFKRKIRYPIWKHDLYIRLFESSISSFSFFSPHDKCDFNNNGQYNYSTTAGGSRTCWFITVRLSDPRGLCGSSFTLVSVGPTSRTWEWMITVVDRGKITVKVELLPWLYSHLLQTFLNLESILNEFPFHFLWRKSA